MKYIQSYENLLSKLFASKNIKRITKGISKILDRNNSIRMLLDFCKWEYSTYHSAFFILKYAGEILSLNNIYIDIQEEKQWVEIMIKKTIILDELLYVKSLLDEYGESMPATPNNSDFDQFNLTLPNTEEFIKKLTIQDFELYKGTKKYNL